VVLLGDLGRQRDQLRPLACVCDVHRQRNRQTADLIAGEPIRLVGGGRHRRDDRTVGIAVIAQQQLPQSAGRRRQDQVVERDTQPVGGRFDVGQPKRGGGESTPRRHYVIEEGRWRVERVREVRVIAALPGAAAHPGEPHGGVFDKPGELGDLPDVVASGGAQQAGRRRV